MISTLHAPSNPTDRTITPIPNDPKGKGKAEPETESLVDERGDELFYRTFRDEESDLPGMMRLVEQELSEPYNVYTFRYFLIDWPHLAFLVFPSPHSTDPIATIICKQDSHRGKTNRGYIAMLSVDRAWRRRGIASKLVELAIDEMARRGAHEVVLETEYDNAPSLSLYDRLGFLREKRLHRFYSNHKDAFRLILPLETHPPPPPETDDEADQARWAVGAGSELGPIPEEGEPPRYFTDGDVEMGGGTPKPPPLREISDWGMYI
ncbi:hypothetical protein I302_103301 [Kwoniella bestiolae CBS 10118]|uniref:Peptide alpha-N-acetyltransferase n=1 Tax=Kwoniella bestiolae CBS 10118 TaxID=1296100 RepID=A0A1B9G815_9TREE|nr:peptide alpha-N-acetyltransferase [Kwoniella bestiolae CBS 10118]OCF27166.1 peptide alpha-N-acetyltransferase [Kwoniella bestiolae CBS 10118]